MIFKSFTSRIKWTSMWAPDKPIKKNNTLCFGIHILFSVIIYINKIYWNGRLPFICLPFDFDVVSRLKIYILPCYHMRCVIHKSKSHFKKTLNKNHRSIFL